MVKYTYLKTMETKAPSLSENLDSKVVTLPNTIDKKLATFPNSTDSMVTSSLIHSIDTDVDQVSKLKNTNHASRILLLPVELQIRVFVMAQNPAIVTVCKQFWELGQSVAVRAHYLIYRYGPTAVLCKRSMQRKIVSLPVIEQLLRFNCYSNVDDWLFIYACELNEPNLGQWVVNATLSCIKNIPEEQQKTLRHFLNVAAMKGSNPIIDMLVDVFDIDIHQGGESTLALACNQRKLDTVKHLIEKYHCDIHCQGEKQLRDACYRGDIELAAYIISLGANVHAYNDAALQNATYKKFPALVKLLLDAGANPETNQNSCIQHAITNKDVESVKYLVAAGVDIRFNDDWALRHACRNGCDAIVEYLLLQAIKTEDAVNMKEGMPLEESLKHFRLSTVELLLKLGANPNLVAAMDGLKFVASSNGIHVGVKDNILRLLFKAGLDQRQQTILMPMGEFNDRTRFSPTKEFDWP